MFLNITVIPSSNVFSSFQPDTIHMTARRNMKKIPSKYVLRNNKKYNFFISPMTAVGDEKVCKTRQVVMILETELMVN